jgi:hypothetical protein
LIIAKKLLAVDPGVLDVNVATVRLELSPVYTSPIRALLLAEVVVPSESVIVTVAVYTPRLA